MAATNHSRHDFFDLIRHRPYWLTDAIFHADTRNNSSIQKTAAIKKSVGNCTMISMLFAKEYDSPCRQTIL